MIEQGCLCLMSLQTASGQREERLVATTVIIRALVSNFIVKKAIFSEGMSHCWSVSSSRLLEASNCRARITQALRMLDAQT